MKKFFKITAIVLATLLLLMIVLPFAFKGRITREIKTVINENVNARVDFNSFGLSFFRSFPAVSFRLDGLSVVGLNEFDGDTLVAIPRFYVSVNLMSLFGNQGYEIKAIELQSPRLMIEVLEGGKASWDITMPAEIVEEEQPVDEEPMAFHLALKRFTISNAYVVYDDKDMDFYTRIENFNHTLRGDFTADYTDISIRETTIDKLFVVYDGIPYLNGVFAELTADIGADLANFAFTFQDNQVRINDLELNFDGNFAWPADDLMLDFRFSSPQTDFKSFLSLVPAVYSADFEGLKTSGTLALNGHVKGIYNELSIPGFGISIEVADGMFQYPDLPAAVTDVFISTKITNPGVDADLTEVAVNRFSLKAAGNPFEMKLNLKTPVSDPQIDAAVNGTIDLGKVKDFYPLAEGETLNGIISSNMEAKGRLSSIENEKYDEFVFNGQLTLRDLIYASPDMPDPVSISIADLAFTPQFANLKSFTVKIGESDFSANGQIDNLLGYALKDQTLTGRFEASSSNFDLNPFMEGGDEPVEETTDTVALSVIEVPANIDFILNSRFNRVLFSNLEITNATGIIRVADQKVSMENLRMNMLGGSMVLNGYYETTNLQQPTIDFAMDINAFDLQQTFTTFNTFAMLAPIGKQATGKFSAGLDLSSALDSTLMPVIPTLAGGGNFNSQAITVQNSPSLTRLADNLKMDMFKSVDLRDVNVDFAFTDGRLNVQPFDLNLGTSKATLSGNHGFDQTINYLMSLEVPRSLFGGAANQVFDNLISQAAGRGVTITPSETVNLGVAFTGTVSDPQIRLNMAQTASDARQQAMDAIESAVNEIVDDLKDEAQEVVDDATEQVNEELEKRAQEVIAQAERQAENIRREAKTNADKLKKEARDQAKKLEDEASGPLAKAAARRAGQEIITQADDNAGKLEREADQRATSLVNEAKTRADKIRLGEE